MTAGALSETKKKKDIRTAPVILGLCKLNGRFQYEILPFHLQRPNVTGVHLSPSNRRT